MLEKSIPEGESSSVATAMKYGLGALTALTAVTAGGIIGLGTIGITAYKKYKKHKNDKKLTEKQFQNVIDRNTGYETFNNKTAKQMFILRKKCRMDLYKKLDEYTEDIITEMFKKEDGNQSDNLSKLFESDEERKIIVFPTAIKYIMERPNKKLQKLKDDIAKLETTGKDDKAKTKKDKYLEITGVNYESEETTEILHKAIDDNLPVEEIKELIENGANVNQKEKKEGFTPLVYILYNKCTGTDSCELDDVWVEIIKELINKGADVNAQDNMTLTPLMIAVDKKVPIKVIKALLDAGADVNVTNIGKTTALYYAVKNSSIEVIDLFIKTAGSYAAKIKSC